MKQTIQCEVKAQSGPEDGKQELLAFKHRVETIGATWDSVKVQLGYMNEFRALPVVYKIRDEADIIAGRHAVVIRGVTNVPFSNLKITHTYTIHFGHNTKFTTLAHRDLVRGWIVRYFDSNPSQTWQDAYEL